jgi:carbonic anhydrase/acetyltransferase-like protein (isoleucine patch superfamily)
VTDVSHHRAGAGPDALLIDYDGVTPHLAPDAWVAPGVTLVGRVRLHAGASVWFGSVLRADGDVIDIGAGSNIQDGCVLHTDPGFPISMGSDVSIGHRAVLHGCTVADEVLIGMGATVLNGARVGTHSIVAAGTVVLEGTEIPPGSLVAGVPGKVRREISEAEVEKIRDNARHYHAYRADYEQALPMDHDA